MRLVLHIGSTKTGSSALQATLYARRAALHEVGVHYPTHGVSAGAHHLLAAAIHPGAWRMHAHELPEDRDAYFRTTAAAILREARSAGAHTTLLSSEYLWGSLAPEIYKAFRDGFAGVDFEIVAYVRRQDEWATSSYMQAVKSGEPRDFATWFQATLMRLNSGLHYFRVINRWAWFLGAAKVHVLRYEDVRANVYAALCDTLGIDVDTTLPPSRVNPSPSVEGVELLLSINRSDLSVEAKRRERERVMRSYKADGVSAPTMSEAEREAILNAAQRSDALIVRHFLSQPSPLFPPAQTPARPLSDREASAEGVR